MSEFSKLVSVADLGLINIGLHSAREDTMLSLLGAPRRPLGNSNCFNNRASDLVKRLTVTGEVGHIRFKGVRPAVESLTDILNRVRVQNPAHFQSLGNAGMLCVRTRRPTSGAHSDKISNHSWGTAIDISVDGEADTTPDQQVQFGIFLLVP